MKFTVQIKSLEFWVLADGKPLTSFKREYEAVSCSEQLEILTDEEAKAIIDIYERTKTL